MARGKPHSDETRAAVLAALLAGQSVTEVARAFNLNHKTVIEWRNAAGITTTRVPQKKQSEIGELVAEYLRESLITLSAQTRFFRDEAWLKTQGASELAVLHGVNADKAIRILGALEAVEIDESPDESE